MTSNHRKRKISSEIGSSSSKPNKTYIGSVLRYPGGKTRAVKTLDLHFPDEIKEICSPFCGGCSFELFLSTSKGVKVYASDAFEPLINFWQSVKVDREKVIKHIENFIPNFWDNAKRKPVSKELFLHLRSTCLFQTTPPMDDFLRAAAFFIINRCSFSGTTCSGGFSKESSEKRLTTSSVEKIRNLDLSNIEFDCKDFRVALQQHSDKFLFLDPPYYLKEKSSLYGKEGDLHREFDHEHLRSLISNRSQWMLCYNNCEQIREYYKEFTIHDVAWSYGMSSDKKSKEFLILSGVQK